MRCDATALGSRCDLLAGHEGEHEETTSWGAHTTWPDGWGTQGALRLGEPAKVEGPVLMAVTGTVRQTSCRSSARRGAGPSSDQQGGAL